MDGRGRLQQFQFVVFAMGGQQLGMVEGGELAKGTVVAECRDLSFLRRDGAVEALHVS